MTITLLNRYGSPVRVNTFNNKKRRNEIIEGWRKQYPREILERVKIEIELPLGDMQWAPILSFDLEND